MHAKSECKYQGKRWLRRCRRRGEDNINMKWEGCWLDSLGSNSGSCEHCNAQDRMGKEGTSCMSGVTLLRRPLWYAVP
jgi:hypothetical protein